MTEEQKKKCEEIYKLYALNYRNSGIIKGVAKFILISCGIMPLFYLDRYGGRWIKIAMLLAKVFNRDITKKEAKEICNAAFIYTFHDALGFDGMFWKIVNYFDKE